MKKMNKFQAFFLKDRHGGKGSHKMSLAEVGFFLLLIGGVVDLAVTNWVA